MGYNYYSLDNLEVYQLSRQLSKFSWEIYERFDWKMQKLMGDQWIRAIDSNGANIAEGYGRFHYLDKIKFYYIARASLIEYRHWTELMFARNKITQAENDKILSAYKNLEVKQNNFITSTYQAKQNHPNKPHE